MLLDKRMLGLGSYSVLILPDKNLINTTEKIVKMIRQNKASDKGKNYINSTRLVVELGSKCEPI